MAIYVLTGEIGSGKTTTLFNEINERTHVGGFLSPIIHKIRQFYFIQRKQYIPMENSEASSKAAIAIGNYLFDSYAFNQAKIQFENDWNLGFDLLILDEFGPLEFKNQGLLPELNPYLEAAQGNSKQSILVVVRSKLVNPFLELYAVNHVIYKEDVPEFFGSIHN